MTQLICNVAAALRERWMVFVSGGTCGVCRYKHGRACLYYSAATDECLCYDMYVYRNGSAPKKWGRTQSPISYRNRAQRRLASQQEAERQRHFARLRKQAADHQRQTLDGTLGAEANSVP